jgi:acetyl esterase/lipase
MRTAARRRALALAVLVTLVALIGFLALAAGVNPGGRTRAVTPRSTKPTLERLQVGTGARSALVVRRRGAGRQPGVLFLHGWDLDGPRAYRPWIDHLARKGRTVIVPRYQVRSTEPQAARGNMLAGVRAALARVPLEGPGVAVVGHSSGGALALDYAAVAAQESLPPADAVLAIYPGRAIKTPDDIPPADPAGVPAQTRLVIMASPTDAVVGPDPPRRAYDAEAAVPVDRRRLITVEGAKAGDHFAPVFGTRIARETFWTVFDGLLAERPAG